MVKKFIEFLEAALLIILTAACVVGVTKHLDSHKGEPTEDTPIVEEVETLSIVVSTKNYEEYFGGKSEIVFEYEEGMTIAEWVESDYNTFGFEDDGMCFSLRVGEEQDLVLYITSSDDYCEFSPGVTFDSYPYFYICE